RSPSVACWRFMRDSVSVKSKGVARPTPADLRPPLCHQKSTTLGPPARVGAAANSANRGARTTQKRQIERPACSGQDPSQKQKLSTDFLKYARVPADAPGPSDGCFLFSLVPKQKQDFPSFPRSSLVSLVPKLLFGNALQRNSVSRTRIDYAFARNSKGGCEDIRSQTEFFPSLPNRSLATRVPVAAAGSLLPLAPGKRTRYSGRPAEESSRGDFPERRSVTHVVPGAKTLAQSVVVAQAVCRRRHGRARRGRFLLGTPRRHGPDSSQ